MQVSVIKNGFIRIIRMGIDNLIVNAIKLTAGIIYVISLIVVAWNVLAPTQYTWLSGSSLGSVIGVLAFFAIFVYAIYLWKIWDL